MEPTHPEESPRLDEPWVMPTGQPQSEGVAGAAAPVAAPPVQPGPPYQWLPTYQGPPPQGPSPYQGLPPYQGPPVYGTPPGYYPPYGPQYGQPSYGAQQPPTNRYPEAALITGLLALTIGNAMSLGVLGVIGGVVGLALGIVGLLRARRLAVGSAGQAVGGIVASALAGVVGVAIAAVAIPDLMSDPADGQDFAGSVNQAPAEWMNPDGEWAGMPRGSLALGQRATINDYSVAVVAIELDADDAIAAAHPRNSPPYGQFVMVTLAVSNRSVAARNPLDDLMASYPGTDNYIYDETSCGARTPRPVSEVGTLELDEAAEYDVCIDVPRYAIGAPRVLVHDLSSAYWDARMWADS